jgi:hypothetical protein
MRRVAIERTNQFRDENEAAGAGQDEEKEDVEQNEEQ